MALFDEAEQQLLEEIDAKAHGDTSIGGRLFAQALRSRAAAGDGWAENRLEMVLQEGARRHFRAWAKRSRGKILVRIGSGARAISRAFAVPVRDDQGLPTGSYQLPFWMDVTFEEIREMVRAFTSQRSALSADIEAMRLGLQLEERCPSAITPKDALSQLGVSAEEYFGS